MMPMVDATAILNEISGALDALANQAVSLVGEDRSFMEMWGWNMPGINRYEFAKIIREPIQLIQSLKTNEVSSEDHQSLTQYVSRIQYLQSNVINNLPGGNAFHVYITVQSTLESLSSLLVKYVPTDIDWQKIESDKLLPVSQIKRLKELITTIDKAYLDHAELADKISAINTAHLTAESLPSDLQNIEEATQSFREATKTAESLFDIKAKAEAYLEGITKAETIANAKLDNIDKAYSAATTQGLGKAFSDRAKALNITTAILSFFLLTTLCIGAFISSERIKFIHGLIERAMTDGKELPIELLWINVILALVSVAAPVWLAWLLTKQIGQRFRLAEDYGYKASVAKAYEGYRREAISVDENMTKRLLNVALDRLDEAPLRWVEKENHGSPLQEMTSAIFTKRLANKESSKVKNMTNSDEG